MMKPTLRKLSNVMDKMTTDELDDWEVVRRFPTCPVCGQDVTGCANETAGCRKSRRSGDNTLWTLAAISGSWKRTMKKVER